MQTIRKFLRPSKARNAAGTQAVIDAGKTTRMNTAQVLRTQLTDAEIEIQQLQTDLLGAALELERAAKSFILTEFEGFAARAKYYRERANTSIAKTQQSERRKEQRRKNPAGAGKVGINRVALTDRRA